MAYLQFKNCVKCRRFTQFPGVEILWKDTVSEYYANCPKLCGNCAFPQNFHTRKLGEITVFYAVKICLVTIHINHLLFIIQKTAATESIIDLKKTRMRFLMGKPISIPVSKLKMLIRSVSKNTHHL